ncbi:MAG: L-threonylcarbamoyladenylate synthase [Pseudomonadota bacterium]
MSETRLLPANCDGLSAVAAILQAGGLVAFPTETVYGLGADARNDRAVARIFEAKERPSFNPLIVHVPSLEAAREYARVEGVMADLAAAYWPGPVSLVVPAREGALSALVTAGLPTVAIRVPSHPLAQDLLAKFGGPVAAPSANPSGRVSPTAAAHVMQGLAGRIEAVVDGGACEVGLESTIIGSEGETPVLLRPGGLPAEAVEAQLGHSLGLYAEATITAPGQMTSHYAPGARLRLNAEASGPGEVWLGFGDGEVAPEVGLSLSPHGDLVEAAANLFAHLRALDGRAETIAVAAIPCRGLGRAINDRLARAAAPRG